MRRYRQNLQAARYGLQPVLNGNGKFNPAEILQTSSLPESNARKNVPRLTGNCFGARRQLWVLFHAPNQRMGIPKVLHRFASGSQVWPVENRSSGLSCVRKVPLVQPRNPVLL